MSARKAIAKKNDKKFDPVNNVRLWLKKLRQNAWTQKKSKKNQYFFFFIGSFVNALFNKN